MENTLALTAGVTENSAAPSSTTSGIAAHAAVRGDGEYDRDRGEGAHADEQDGEGGAVGVASSDGQAGRRADSVESQHEGYEAVADSGDVLEEGAEVGEDREVGVIHHPVVGELTLSYETPALPADPDQTICLYTAEPGSASAETLRLLASWSTPTHVEAPSPSGRGTAHRNVAS
ncbi:MmyB family transcriptional regulator [Streptomyces mirabilis]|uniref:MmyB family transcriptional regulator n=1 Tax=Streptomyces mirabilis TaxID=68239 RepID=UPI0036D8118F